jgi:hypothetical protein
MNITFDDHYAAQLLFEITGEQDALIADEQGAAERLANHLGYGHVTGDSMRTLSTTPMLAPERFPDLAVEGKVGITAIVTPRKGDHYFVCNPFEEIAKAITDNEPFIAHKVIGMEPVEVIIMPGTIASVERAS